MRDIIEKLKRIISEKLDVEIDLQDINDTDDLLEGGLGLDSIAVMELISLIEEQFNFDFEEEELQIENFKNLKILAEYITKKTTVGE